VGGLIAHVRPIIAAYVLRLANFTEVHGYLYPCVTTYKKKRCPSAFAQVDDVVDALWAKVDRDKLGSMTLWVDIETDPTWSTNKLFWTYLLYDVQ